MERLPDDVLEVFEKHASAKNIRRSTHGSVELYKKEDGMVGAEFTVHVGHDLLDSEYIITGVREHEDYVEVWVDSVEGRIQDPTVAERAARIIKGHTAARIEANDSESPREQYIDVFPDPHEQATEDWNLREDAISELRANGIRLRTMSCGRERSDWNDENYRVWFTEIED